MILQEFYQHLYKVHSTSKEDIENYIKENLKSKLLENDKRELEKEIKDEEIAEVINRLKMVKLQALMEWDQNIIKLLNQY